MPAGPFDYGGWTIRQSYNSSSYLKVAYGWVSETEERWWLYDPEQPNNLSFHFPGYGAPGFISRFVWVDDWSFGDWSRRCAYQHPATADHSDGHPDSDNGIAHETQARLYAKANRHLYIGNSLPTNVNLLEPPAYPSPAGCPNEESLTPPSSGSAAAPSPTDDDPKTTVVPRSHSAVRQVDPGFLRIRPEGMTNDLGILFVVDDGGQDNVIQRIEYWMLYDDVGSYAALDVVNLTGDGPGQWGNQMNQTIYDYFLNNAGKNPSVTVVSVRYYPCAVSL